jgi:hypothetical protein
VAVPSKGIKISFSSILWLAEFLTARPDVTWTQVVPYRAVMRRKGNYGTHGADPSGMLISATIAVSVLLGLAVACRELGESP